MEPGPGTSGHIELTYVLFSFVEKNIDYSYDWNEWNLRRRALQLADLRNKATVSTQSNQSHFRRDVDTQHYSPRQQATQTMKESSTNVPK